MGNYGIAGGSDSYGYVSQADLWLRGHLRIEQPAARNFPWPNGPATLAPLGYRPSVDRNAIVPIYAPGLPLIMAAFKGLAGQCAISWIVPLAGGLLVAVTFAIGRALFSDDIGAAAAWLVATSPAVVSMLLQPMSDIPVAAAWGVAILGCVKGSRKGAALAGVGAALAILIRPNLVHLGLFMGLWLIGRELRRRPFRFDPSRMLLFGVPAAMACFAVAKLNIDLYGSVTSSGYGPLENLFSQYRIPANLHRYSSWLISSQTPLAAVGLLALFLPARLVTTQPPNVPGRGLLTAITAGVIGGYLCWIIFDAWWYLRFLLPCWPAMCLSSASLLSWPSGRTFRKPALAILAFVGCYGLWYAHRAGVTPFDEGDRRYAIVARLVRNATPPNSMIFSIQHSGSLRYYGGRMTLRYDFLNQRWLDRAVAFFSAQGVHPYFLLDEWEVPGFQARFQTDNTLGALKVAKVFEYDGGPTVYLYDPLQPERPGEKPTIFKRGDVRMDACPVPVSPPQLVLKN
jgi:hypothetical protein